MAQPVWITPAGNLGVIPEGVFYQQNISALDPDGGTVKYRVIAGQLPQGIQVTDNGSIAGVPFAVARVQGVPLEVSRDVTSKFAVRAYTVDAFGNPLRISDRTFSLTVTGDDVPEFVTPAGEIGYYYDGDRVSFRFEIAGLDPADTHTIRVVAGQLPGGLTVSPSGLLSGYIEPAGNVFEPPGYDLTPSGTEPYDFISSSINKNYEFTLEVSDGTNSTLRTFSMYVYDRNSLRADSTDFTADNTQLTADQSIERRPFLVNDQPSNLGRYRSENRFGYQFRAKDYDTTALTFALSPAAGSAAVPGIELDPESGWYYGEIPDVGLTETQYQFNVYVRQTQLAELLTVCVETVANSNLVVCDSTENLAPGVPVVFVGSEFGGLSTDLNRIYFVRTVESATEFTVTANLRANPLWPLQAPQYLPDAEAVELTDALGSVQCYRAIASDPYPFSITIVGEVDTEVTWITPPDLGTIDNGDISLLAVQAVNAGGRDLQYRLTPEDPGLLPQGLELLPSGDISGRVTFNTFSIDQGATTFDKNPEVTRNAITETTWDSVFRFNVNAYSQLSDGQEVISVNRGFRVKVNRKYNTPYQNLLIKALPPFRDRNLINQVLGDQDIFHADDIYRSTDPYFGKSTDVTYTHAYGLAAETLDTYIQSLELNHYRKNLVLGSFKTAQALDSNGQVVYEVVYCDIVDDLVNSQGQSVSAAVPLPYVITNPYTQQPTGVVYPNSLINMRNQVISQVGKVSDYLPLWMTSKQSDGRVLGFVTTWVLCYTKPGRSAKILYDLNNRYGNQLAAVDFQVDRYILDASLTANWDAQQQNWTPEPNMTTFDRLGPGSQLFAGNGETTFDNKNLRFVEPVDMYDASDAGDKYLIFPKINILG